MGETPWPAWQSPKTIVVLLSVITLILAASALKAIQFVAMPLVLGFFLATLVQPIHAKLNNLLPRGLHWLSLVLTMILIVAVVAAVVTAAVISIEIVVRQSGPYFQQVQDSWARIQQWAQERNIPLSSDMISSEGARARILTIATAGFTSFSSILGLLALIFFFVLFMLLEASDWEHKVRRATRDNGAQPVRILDIIARKMRRYLLNRIIISCSVGVGEGLWLLLMGVDFWYLWGIIFVLFNWIPYIGTSIAMALPCLISVLQYGVGRSLVVLAGLIAIDQILSNFGEPRLQGSTLRVSPIVLLFSVVFWGLIWGAVGMLLAVPMTVAVMTICANVQALKPVALLLSRSAQDEM